jgi:hypothetical protein
MPTTKVRLLSMELLLSTHGGTSIQLTDTIHITLGNGTDLTATYCPWSNLPYLLHNDNLANNTPFLPAAFNYTTTNPTAYFALMDCMNTNITTAQKDVLGWHQHLSHTSISWIQTLMHTKKEPRCMTAKTPVTSHSKPFLPSKYPQSPTCDMTSLKCQACLFAKAHRQPHNPQ